MAAEKIIYDGHINHYKDPDNGWNVKVVEYLAEGISFPMLTEFFRINLEHNGESQSVSFEHLMIPIALPEFRDFLTNEKKLDKRSGGNRLWGTGTAWFQQIGRTGSKTAKTRTASIYG